MADKMAAFFFFFFLGGGGGGGGRGEVAVVSVQQVSFVRVVKPPDCVAKS